MPDYVPPLRNAEEIREDMSLTPAQRLAWQGIRAVQGSQDQTKAVGTAYLAKRSGLPRETLSRALGELWDAGVLRYEGGRTNKLRKRRYRCYLQGGAPSEDPFEEPKKRRGSAELCDERSQSCMTRDHTRSELRDEKSHSEKAECDERSQSYVTRDHTSPTPPYKDQSFQESLLPSIPSLPAGNVPGASIEAAKGSKQAGEKVGMMQLVRGAGASPPNPSVPYQPPGLSLKAAIEWGGRVHAIPADVVTEWFEANELTDWLDRQGESVRRWKPWLLDYWRDRQARQQGKKQRQGRIAHPKPSAPVGSTANPKRQAAPEARQVGAYLDFNPAEIRRAVEREQAEASAKR